MKEYLVTWVIDIDADTPEEAAAQALICQRDNQSTATIFEVIDKETKELTIVDFNEGV